MDVKIIENVNEEEQRYEIFNIVEAEKEDGGIVNVIDKRDKTTATKKNIEERIVNAQKEFDKWTDVLNKIKALEK